MTSCLSSQLSVPAEARPPPVSARRARQDGQFLAHRIAGPGDTDPHVDQRDREPGRHEQLRRDREGRLGPAPELAEQQEQTQQHHTAADHHRHVHAPFLNPGNPLVLS
jgi:hypothetical protein